MAALIWQNRLYRGDCLQAMRQLQTEGITVDLIYLDPPFNSNRVYNLVFREGGKDAQQVVFSDMWGTPHAEQLRLAFTDMLDQMDDVSASLKRVIEMWVNVLLEGGNDDRRMLNYLIYITERLIVMQQILKPAGSIYLHCDPTASHYLKIMMDAVFGRKNFLNELIWFYRKWTNSATHFQRNHDVILVYCKQKGSHTFNKIYEKNVPQRAKYDRGWDSNVVSGNIRQLIVYNKKKAENKISGGDYDRIIYREKQKQVAAPDVWEIPIINSQAKERMGYATQKPVSLLDRIIKASSPRDGIVLDPFCGCGTTIEAAHLLGRHWIGMDISADAIGEIERRLSNLSLTKSTDYSLTECDPQTKVEYDRLSPYQKQQFLVQRVGGTCGPRGADGGIDGTLTLHLGDDRKGNPQWGKMVISVKTGHQAQPAHVDQLIGVMGREQAAMGGLIVDVRPTDGMKRLARTQRKLNYRSGNYRAVFDKLQILTADEVLEGTSFDIPPTLAHMKKDFWEESNKQPKMI